MVVLLQYFGIFNLLFMKRIFTVMILISGFLIFESFSQTDKTMNKSDSDEFYSLSAKTLTDGIVNFSDYKGKVVLIVNTASKCGFTPQYAGLQELNELYSSKGLVVLGFPCNQFGGQEPGGVKEIGECLMNYGVNFQMFEKVDVNGENTHPVFVYLKSKLTGTFGSNIKWNFTKFIIDRDGKPFKRYASTTKPESLAKDIEILLGK